MSRAKTEYVCLNGTPLGSVHMQSDQFKYPGSTLLKERWWHEYSYKQEDTVWMEQLEEDVRRPMRQESTTTREGKYIFCTNHNGRQLGSKVFICNKLDVSKHPRSTLQHVMLNVAAMYRPVQCPAVNTQYYMIYYYLSIFVIVCVITREHFHA